MAGIFGIIAVVVGWDSFAIVKKQPTISAAARKHPYLAFGFCVWLPVHLYRGMRG